MKVGGIVNCMLHSRPVSPLPILSIYYYPTLGDVNRSKWNASQDTKAFSCYYKYPGMYYRGEPNASIVLVCNVNSTNYLNSEISANRGSDMVPTLPTPPPVECPIIQPPARGCTDGARTVHGLAYILIRERYLPSFSLEAYQFAL